MKPKILLHSCCADCAIYVAHKLMSDFEVGVYYYNPNIHPKAEFEKRYNEFKKHLNKKIKLIKGKYDVERWNKLVKGLEKEPERGARCDVCYLMRLEEAVKYAKKHGYDYFATTLIMGRQKKTETLFELAKQLADKYQVKFYEEDLKKHCGTNISSWLSKQMKLYRQNYCGCRYSKH